MSLRFQCFRTPTWAALLDGEAAAAGAGDDDALLKVRRGWQRSAGAAVDKRVFEMLFADLDCASRALRCPNVQKKRTVVRRLKTHLLGPAPGPFTVGVAGRWAPQRRRGPAQAPAPERLSLLVERAAGASERGRERENRFLERSKMKVSS